MKAVLLFVGLSAPSVLTAQVNPPAFSPVTAAGHTVRVKDEVPAPHNCTTGAGRSIRNNALAK